MSSHPPHPTVRGCHPRRPPTTDGISAACPGDNDLFDWHADQAADLPIGAEQPGKIAGDGRPVEAQLVFHRAFLLRRGEGAQDVARHVAGRNFHHRKHDNGNQQHGKEHGHQTSDNVTGHRVSIGGSRTATFMSRFHGKGDMNVALQVLLLLAINPGLLARDNGAELLLYIFG
jgi:hypothetical protein